jgi:hypothetical protein
VLLPPFVRWVTDDLKAFYLEARMQQKPGPYLPGAEGLVIRSPPSAGPKLEDDVEIGWGEARCPQPQATARYLRRRRVRNRSAA